jgi:hypothetical protein
MERLQLDPLAPCCKELEKFIEPNTELGKSDFLKIITYRVSYYAITIIKLLVFSRIGRDEKGEIYFY